MNHMNATTFFGKHRRARAEKVEAGSLRSAMPGFRTSVFALAAIAGLTALGCQECHGYGVGQRIG